MIVEKNDISHQNPIWLTDNKTFIKAQVVHKIEPVFTTLHKSTTN